MGKKTNHTNIRPAMQRKIAKMGRMASGAGKTVRATHNSKEIDHFTTLR